MLEQQGQPSPLRTNIRRITRYLADRITGMGIDIYITYSHTSKSRYLEFRVGKWRSFIIRISDHPSSRHWKYDYDVYTSKPRWGAMNYMDLIHSLKKLIKVNKTGGNL